tara:strand:+ start:452 stop:676 length:225 start_codon:yes stop_codon:yes gene_type:complete
MNKKTNKGEKMTKEVKIYASVKFPKDWKGKKDIHIQTLEEHLKKYNALSNVDGNELKLFLNEDEARKHFNKINN